MSFSTSLLKDRSELYHKFKNHVGGSVQQRKRVLGRALRGRRRSRLLRPIRVSQFSHVSTMDKFVVDGVLLYLYLGRFIRVQPAD